MWWLTKVLALYSTFSWGFLKVLFWVCYFLFFNDLPLSSKFLALLFADDTTLLLTHENLDELIRMANEEFRKICEFFRINRLVLHLDKTKFLLFTRSSAKKTVQILLYKCDPLEYLPTLKLKHVLIDFLGYRFHHCTRPVYICQWKGDSIKINLLLGFIP